MIKLYRKTGTIKAEQFDNSTEMAEKYHTEYDGSYILPFRIDTPDGWLGMKVGDWIVTGVNGEHCPIADDVFKKTYAEIPVIPEEVSLSIKDWKKHSRGLDQIFGMVYQYEITRTQGSTTINWIMCGNQDAFARAWLDGYQLQEDE